MGEIGLDIDYFYSLTLRQFSNILNGYRRKEDSLSKERWMIARKVMYASLQPYMKAHQKETDLLAFPWEDEIKTLTEEENEELVLEAERVKDFYLGYDARKIEA